VGGKVIQTGTFASQTFNEFSVHYDNLLKRDAALCLLLL